MIRLYSISLLHLYFIAIASDHYKHLSCCCFYYYYHNAAMGIFKGKVAGHITLPVNLTLLDRIICYK